jgi:hypothetical protein
MDLQPGLDRVAGSTRLVSWVTPDLFFLYFFFNLAQFQPQIGRFSGRPVRLGRVSKL